MLYKLNVLDRTGNLLTPKSLEKQLEWIIEDADQMEGKGRVCVIGGGGYCWLKLTIPYISYSTLWSGIGYHLHPWLHENDTKNFSICICLFTPITVSYYTTLT